VNAKQAPNRADTLRISEMTSLDSLTRQTVATYIRAKDENRPYLMKRAFADSATLEMIAKPGTISFPPVANGIDAITDILVRQFAQSYENVHTFCLASPPQDDDKTFSCRWLVGMSEKATRQIRVGCGRYDWVFQMTRPRLAERLTVTIDLMQTLPPADLELVMDWLSCLPYPWCSSRSAVETAPTVENLEPVIHYISVA